jgi:hypothetical protein
LEHITFTISSGQENPAGGGNRTLLLQNKEETFALDAADIIDYC